LDGKINIHANNEYVFFIACEGGHLEVAKWLYGLDEKINIHIDNEYPFCYSCYNGHLEVAKWLYGLDGAKEKINIHVNDERLFTVVCGDGHINCIKYLVSLDDKDYTIDVHDAMVKGILNFYRIYKRIRDNSYIKIKKMLSLVKEYENYHKNIDNIKFLMLLYNDLNYGFMIDIFGYMKNGIV